MTQVLDQFNTVGFLVIKNLIDTKELCEVAKVLSKDGNFKDPQCLGSPALYGMDEMTKLHDDVKDLIEPIIGMELLKTYNYFRVYQKGAYLKPHFDRPACEISVSLNLGGDDWELGIFDYDHVPHTYLLKAGDALIYHGCDLAHWRPDKFKGNELVQIFLHHVDRYGQYAWARDDIRKSP